MRTPHQLRLGLGYIVAVVALSQVSAVAGQMRTMRFSYVRGAGAEECPDDETIRAGVAARLGYEPFDEGSREAISATVTRNGRTFAVRIQIMNASGAVTAQRDLSSRQNDCLGLTSAMELAISLAIDPLPRPPLPAPPPAAPVVLPPPPPPPVVVMPPPAPPIVIVQRSEPERSPRVPVVFAFSAGAAGGVGWAPAASLGGTLQASLRRARLSIAIEGRADRTSTAPLRSGEVHASLLAGALVPCWHAGAFAGCALATFGVVRASGYGLVDARYVSAPFVALGGRAALEVPSAGPWFLYVHGDVMAPLIQNVLRVSGEAVWSSPPVSAAVALGAGVRFP